jgi:hypothetical protein
MALLGFKWSATTEATEDLASDTLLSSLVELQADNKATDMMEMNAKRRFDMMFFKL